MRKTISINKSEYPELHEKLLELDSSGKNISKFFSDAATFYLENKGNNSGSNEDVIKYLDDFRIEIKEMISNKQISSIETSSDNIDDNYIEDINAMFGDVEDSL